MGQSLSNGLNRAWRVVGTGLSFAVFGIGGFLLGAIACVVLRLIIHDRDRHAQVVRRMVSRAFGLFVTFMTLVGVLRWRVEGREHWRRDRAYLVVANHPTLIDIVFLLALFDGADCVVKVGAVRNPFWGLLVRAADYVSNEDPAALLDEAVARLEAGRTVVMFPEGTRTTPGKPPAFGAAAGVIAVRAGSWCLPAVIGCTPPTLYKHLPWYRVPASRVEFRLALREPWRVERASGDARSQRLAARDFTRRLEEFYAREALAVPSADATGEGRPAASPVL